MKNLHTYTNEQLFQTMIVCNPDHPDYLWSGVIEEVVDGNYVLFRKLGTHTRYTVHRDDIGFLSHDSGDRSFQCLMVAIESGDLGGEA